MQKSRADAAAAAAAAARADALERASRLKGTERGREAVRLAAENKALLEMLTSAAVGDPTIKGRLDAIKERYQAEVRLQTPIELKCRS